jgi:hypothetical protein
MLRYLTPALGLLLLLGCPRTRDVTLPDDDDAADDDDSAADDDDSAADDDDSAADDDDDVTPADIDEDGLTNAFEEHIGTDPLRPDTDGDGWLDGTEYAAWFRPWDATDYPYIGSYPRGPIPDDGEILGEGYDQGMISSDWSHHDQYMQMLYLHRFHGNVVVIWIDAEFAPPIGHIAPDMQLAYDELKDQGFVILNFLVEGTTYGSAPDAERFAETHDLTFPIFEHAGQTISDHYQYAPFIPHFSVLDRELRIRAISFSGYNEWEQARELVEELLLEPAPEVDWPAPF